MSEHNRRRVLKAGLGVVTGAVVLGPPDGVAHAS
ncbi:MAG: twin-arginine translocation signal domain-containing protein, partial [Saccharothrix sp.]|nr:twin-arginine translocation signal domain-containing protein [Saccharothrix sp.]